MTQQTSASHAGSALGGGKFSLSSLHVGPLPLPLYCILTAIIAIASIYGKLPADMIGGIAVMMCMGVLLGDIGMRTPILKDIGGPAILSIFLPSVMVYYGLLNDGSMKAITAFMKGSNFLYFYISCLITGSLLGMARQVLVQGFLRMFVPLFVGTIASLAAGTCVGVLMGMDAKYAFFYVVVPIISGGLGEGILPLSLAYAEITQMPYEQFIPMLAPAAMLGNVTAIILAGYLKRLGEKRPELSGNGLLVRTRNDDTLRAAQTAEKPIDFNLMGAGLLMACTAFIFGQLAAKFIPIPAPIIMIFSVALVKVSGLLPESMERGAYHLYRFVATNLTWALCVGVGVLYTPWKDVIAAISPAYIVTVVTSVLAMVGSGFFIARFLNMYPIESAIVTACHSGLGGTGDVAILSSAGRMEMMPFAQISTRIGGACTVVMAVILLRALT